MCASRECVLVVNVHFATAGNGHARDTDCDVLRHQKSLTTNLNYVDSLMQRNVRMRHANISMNGNDRNMPRFSDFSTPHKEVS